MRAHGNKHLRKPTSFFGRLFHWAGGGAHRAGRADRRHRRLGFEPLENRELLSVSVSAPIYLASSGGEFGYSVAADGNLAVVGAPGNDRAYVYDLTSSQRPIPWMRTLSDSSVPPGSGFGSSVAISGTKVVVGAPNQKVDSQDNAGKAYVFDASDGHLVTELATSVAVKERELGFSVAISGNTAVVGAPGSESPEFAGPGLAFIFNATTGTVQYTLTGQPTRNRTTDLYSDRFGFSVAISGTTIAVGAPADFERIEHDPRDQSWGDAYTFDAANGNPTHTDGGLHHPGITLEDEDNYGFSVAVSQEKAVAGSRIDRILHDSGYAYLYDLRGQTSYQPYVVQPQDDKDFGRSVAVQGGTLLVGSGVLKRNGWGTDSYANAGGVRVYDISDPTASPALAATISSPGNSQDGSFGASVALTGGGNVAVVGEPYASGGGACAYQMTWTLPTPTIWLANDTGLYDYDRVTKEWGLDTDPPNPAFGAWWDYSFSYDNINWSAWSQGFSPTEGPQYLKVRQRNGSGSVSGESNHLDFTYDTIAPTVTYTGVDSIAIALNDASGVNTEALGTVDRDSFSLTRDGGGNLLSAATFSGSGTSWSLSGLYDITGIDGDYNMTFSPPGVMEDIAGNTLGSAPALQWTVIPPIVTAVAPSLTMITDASAPPATQPAFSVTFEYVEPMDTLVNPAVSFSTDVSSTLTLDVGSSGWTDSDTFVAWFNVADANVYETAVGVVVSGAQDVAGNAQTAHNGTDDFRINTLASAAVRRERDAEHRHGDRQQRGDPGRGGQGVRPAHRVRPGDEHQLQPGGDFLSRGGGHVDL